MTETSADTHLRVTLEELFAPFDLERHLADGQIRQWCDPASSLVGYTYTAAAERAGTWEPAVRAARGLLVDSATGEVLARPWEKFFSYDHPLAPDLSGRPVEVYDKLDGSLGILVRDSAGSYRIATRGGLGSVPALEAARIWGERYAGTFVPREGLTYLFEIVSPASRVVVDYGPRGDLHLLGAVEIATGRSVSLREVAASWPGPVVERLPFGTLEEVLAAPHRPGLEGYVVVDVETGERVKVKDPDYVRRHALVTGLSTREVWEWVAVDMTRTVPDSVAASALQLPVQRVQELRGHARGDLSALLEGVPDELYAQAEAAAETLRRSALDLGRSTRAAFDALVAGLRPGSPGELFAEVARTAPDKFCRAAWTRLAAGHDIAVMCVAQVRPARGEIVGSWRYRKSPTA